MTTHPVKSTLTNDKYLPLASTGESIMKMKYIALTTLTLSLPLLAHADNGKMSDFIDPNTVTVTTQAEAAKTEQKDNDAATLAYSLGLKDKSFIFAKTPKARAEKVRKKKRKAGYRTSTRTPGAQIDERMTFASGSAQLNQRTKQRVSTLADVYKQHKEIQQIVITGHTDTVGNNANNMALSRARAQSVKQQLVAFGVPAHKISAHGYGETQLLPGIPGTASANRRVEYSIVKR